MMGELVNIIEDEDRLEALRRTSLLDSPPEEAFDRSTRLATMILGVPVALVSLLDGDRVFFKSQCGLSEPLASARQVPLTNSFCRSCVETGQPLIVADTRQDPRFAHNRSELEVIAYVGIPLTTSAGHALGTLCVVDRQPRDWTEEEVGILRVLATSAMSEIEQRRLVGELRALTEDLQALVESGPAELLASH